MNNKQVTVIDLGIGNLFSIVSALKYCGSEVTVTSESKIIENSSLIILPGDGAFNYAMMQVKERGLLKTLKNIKIQIKNFWEFVLVCKFYLIIV